MPGVGGQGTVAGVVEGGAGSGERGRGSRRW